MGIIEEVTPLHPFLHMERERGKKKKTPLERLMGIANFILPLVLFRIHVRSFLHAHTHTHIHLFLLLCCSYTPMLSSGSLFYLWLEFNSPFFFFLFFPHPSIAVKWPWVTVHHQGSYPLYFCVHQKENR